MNIMSATDPVIIARGGYLHDFPILLANCMKYNFNDFGILKDCLFIDVSHLDGKLHIPSQNVFDLAVKCSSYAQLESILFEYVKRKTALDMNQLCKIAYWYHVDRYLHCK